MPGQVYTCTDSRGREVGGGKNNHKSPPGEWVAGTCLTCGVLKLMKHVAESRATSAAHSTTFGLSVVLPATTVSETRCQVQCRMLQE